MTTQPGAGTRSSSARGTTGWSPGALLAKAGLSTLVLERRDLVGGACVTEEIAPGCRASTTSYIASMLRPEVIRALNLASSRPSRWCRASPGCRWLSKAASLLAAWDDPARTAAEIERYSQAGRPGLPSSPPASFASSARDCSRC